MARSTSHLIQGLLGFRLPHLLDEYDAICESVTQLHEPFRIVFAKQAKNRAAFLIPQFLAEVCYESLCGVPMPAHLRGSCHSFSLVCLSLAIGDDMIDSDHTGFESTMERACVSVALMDFAYARIASEMNETVRLVVSEGISSLIRAVTHTGAAEIQYRKKSIFDLASYMAITRLKTSCYTRHSLLLAANVLEDTHAYDALLTKLGNCLGTAIQLLDDLYDVGEDSRQEQHNQTYPEYLVAHNQGMEPVFRLIEQALKQASDLARQLPHPDKLTFFLEKAGIVGSGRETI